MGLTWKGWSLGLTISGFLLVALALVWLLAIFPIMAKMPADYERVINFEGTYQVMNPETGMLDEIPVNVERLQQATDVQGNVLLINQTITSTHAQAGIELTDFGLSEVLGVDRSTRAYDPDCSDMGCTGQFCFPSGVEKESYSIWVQTAGRPLDAEFTGEEDFHGLSIFTFQISEQALDIGLQAGTGLPQVVDVLINLKVEPVSGVTVDTQSDTTIKVVPAPGMEMPVYISSLSFTDETMTDLVDTASSARNMILWTTVYGFWIAIGLGAALTLGGVIMAARAKTD